MGTFPLTKKCKIVLRTFGALERKGILGKGAKRKKIKDQNKFIEFILIMSE
jgi:hypothetical protein